MNKSESIASLAKALALAQGELKNPPLDESADTGKYTYRYVSLGKVRDVITAVFSKHGLSVIQSAGTGQRGPVITTLLMHSSGEWVESDPLEVPAAKQDAQGYGSAITYARRYALQAVANVVGDDDDDARAAVAQNGTPAKAAAKPAAKAAPKAKPAPLTGEQFAARLKEYDAKLNEDGVIAKGELVVHVQAEGKKAKLPEDVSAWGEAQIKQAREWTKTFEARRRAENRQPAHA